MEFLKKYGLTSEEIEEWLEDSDRDYIESFTDYDIEGKEKILLKYGIDFINELILFDIGIFAYTDEEFEKRIVKMIKSLGPNYLDIVGEDMVIIIEYVYGYRE